MRFDGTKIAKSKDLKQATPQLRSELRRLNQITLAIRDSWLCLASGKLTRRDSDRALLHVVRQIIKLKILIVR